MAVVQNTLIGKSKQSVGGTTFSTWKGINVLKSKPTSVANPKTDLQLMQRSALQQVVSIYRLINVAIKKGWRKFAVQKSEYNAFTSDALTGAFDFTAPPAADLDPTLLKITNGTVTSGGDEPTAVVNMMGGLNLSWSNALVGNQAATDEFQCAVLSPNGTRVKAIIIDKIPRSAGSVELAPLAGETFAADDVVIYGFTRSDYTDASVGSFVLATSL